MVRKGMMADELLLGAVMEIQRLSDSARPKLVARVKGDNNLPKITRDILVFIFENPEEVETALRDKLAAA